MNANGELPVLLWRRDGDGFLLEHCNAAAKSIAGGVFEDSIGLSLDTMIRGDRKIADDFAECYRCQSSFVRRKFSILADKSRDLDSAVIYAYVPRDHVALVFCDGRGGTVHDDATIDRSRIENIRLALREKDIAIRQLMDQLSQEREIIKKNIQINLNYAVMPLLKNLRTKVSPELEPEVKSIEDAISMATSQFIGDLRNEFTQLSPRELQICNMIRSGLLSKEISATLCISVRTVEKTRQQIRRKLGLTNTGTGLAPFLNSGDLGE
jgi:hypothetical protein